MWPELMILLISIFFAENNYIPAESPSDTFNYCTYMYNAQLTNSPVYTELECNTDKIEQYIQSVKDTGNIPG